MFVSFNLNLFVFMNFSKSFLLINSFSYCRAIHKSEGVSVRAFLCVKNGGGCYGCRKCTVFLSNGIKEILLDPEWNFLSHICKKDDSKKTGIYSHNDDWSSFCTKCYVRSTIFFLRCLYLLFRNVARTRRTYLRWRALKQYLTKFTKMIKGHSFRAFKYVSE